MGIWTEATVMRLLAAAVIFTTALVYVRGWRRLQQLPAAREGTRPPAAPRSLVTFMAGLALLAAALISPLGYLATQYFSGRIIQHMLIVASIPSLLLLPNPVPALIHGLSARWRDAALAALAPSGHRPPTAARRFFLWATSPSVSLLAFLSICWFWYDPAIHQATLPPARGHTLVHAIEITSLLTVGLVNWWHITAAWPNLHGRMHPVIRMAYAFISIWPVKLIGLILLFIPEPFYQYPATFQFSGLDINDYSFGAMIAWIVSGLAYGVAAVVLFRDWLGEEETKPTLPESAWATDEAMIAPGIKR